MNKEKYFVYYHDCSLQVKKVWNPSYVLTIGYPFKYFIEKTINGIRIHSNSKVLDVSQQELQNGTHIILDKKNNSFFKIIAIPNDKSNVNYNFIHTPINTDETAHVFKKTTIISMSVMFLIIILSTFTDTKKKSQEILPEQYAKIILKPKAKKIVQSKAEITSSANNDSGSKTKSTIVQKSKLIQVMSSKTIQNSIKGLLNGGMNSLLKQSQFSTGSDVTAMTKRVLSSTASEGIASTTLKSLGQVASAQISSIGGSGLGNGQIGYGSGQKAGLSGQGKGFIGIEANTAEVDEGLTKDEVGRVIHSHINEIRYCHETAMLKTPNIDGKLALLFTIGSDGLVKKTSIKESSLPDSWLEDCVIRRLVRWKFPQPRGGVDVSVTYPFVFKKL